MPVRIIKAHSAREVARTEVYTLIDLQRQGEQFVESAKRDANEILAAVRREADGIREKTLVEARLTGRQEGLRDAEQLIAQQASELAETRVSAQLRTALPALQAAAESLQAERDRWLVRWEQTAVRLGVAIAERLLQRQLVSHPEFAAAMISDALRLAAGQPKLTVYLHPDDLSAWGDRASQIVESLTSCADTIFVADPGAMRGGCRIETRHGEIDARIETMLQRIAEELLEE